MSTEIVSPDAASDVWAAMPLVYSQCNKQSTYAQRGAPYAYALAHMLDRYVRSWLALELLLKNNCLPMAAQGVRAIDVGTGPGPSAFAIHDFYSELYIYLKARHNAVPTPPVNVVAIEFDAGTNSLRHRLAEHVARNSPNPCSILSLCSAILDLKDTDWPRQRVEMSRRLQRDAFDENAFLDADSTAEAHSYSQALHRYRLFIFSNFLTTPGVVQTFGAEILRMLKDAMPGAVLLLIGGKSEQYSEIYESVSALASESGFERRLSGEVVASSQSSATEIIDEYGRCMHEQLQTLSASAEFQAYSTPTGKSSVWAFRKPGRYEGQTANLLVRAG